MLDNFFLTTQAYSVSSSHQREPSTCTSLSGHADYFRMLRFVELGQRISIGLSLFPDSPSQSFLESVGSSGRGRNPEGHRASNLR